MAQSISSAVESELIIKKSRFIGCIQPVHDRAGALTGVCATGGQVVALVEQALHTEVHAHLLTRVTGACAFALPMRQIRHCGHAHAYWIVNKVSGSIQVQHTSVGP